MASESAPVLSTPAEHILEEPALNPVPYTDSRISDEQLYVQYEIKRTVEEIRMGRWRRIALQFPDAMLVDAPRVFDCLTAGLRARPSTPSESHSAASEPERLEHATARLDQFDINAGETQTHGDWTSSNETDARLCILGDTSYGACCVDEVAAEHMDAEVVVHYGRSCLSPTARLPVIYVFTSKPLDLNAAILSFQRTYPEKSDKVCLMADIPYQSHLPALLQKLQAEGYTDLLGTEIAHDPASLLPNRQLPSEMNNDPQKLKHYSIFHISSPPTSLLLILSSRVKSVYIYSTDRSASPNAALEASTVQVLRRRYGLITSLATASIFGILINTLSVSNYMQALQHCQDLISKAGKKSYVFVVGKVNAAKVANFSEIGGWVVIGCWESSLIESKDFYRPIITPFELEVALTDDANRVWGGEWIGDFGTLLGRGKESDDENGYKDESEESNSAQHEDSRDQDSDDEPPEFDLRTGRYVSHSRPMGRAKPAVTAKNSEKSGDLKAPTSSALVQRARGDLATVNGAVSPAAEFLRSERTWQGLGSDYEVAYERDATGKIRGAAMEEGRSGVAQGYVVGRQDNKH